MQSTSQRNLLLTSPTKYQNPMKFNQTPDDTGKQKQYFIKDKEAMFEEIQTLKQSKNQLFINIKKLQAQVQYYKKEAMYKEESSPLKSSSRFKQLYQERIAILEEENSKLHQQLEEIQAFVSSLKNPLSQTNLELFSLQLQNDNQQLTTLLEDKENENQELKKANNKLTIKCNALQIQQNKLKALNNQLLLEINELKKKQHQYESRISQKDIPRVDEKFQIEFEQTKLEIRKFQQQLKQQEQSFTNQLQLEHEKIEKLEKRNKELQKTVSLLENKYEQEKVNYQQLQQSQKFIRRTVILKTIQPEEPEKYIEQETKIRKLGSVEKSEILHVAKKIKLNLIAQQVSLKKVEEYLLTNEILTLQQLEENLSCHIFGLVEEEEISQLAAYLADLENDEVETTALRVKSIFKNLMENYTILTNNELSAINQSIALKRTQINEYLTKKHPQIFSIGSISIDQYLDSLQNLEIQFNKNEIDHLVALITKYNRSPRVLLQQIYAPFYICNEPISDDEESTFNQPVAQLHNPMQLSEDEEQMSALDIKMCNSQELRKKSHTELPQF
ncbi:unnamed protein product (macronuclear) [Paramecium tetraurelia]|uniref:EF-hand domain-containing protein n=1 Tax=Paramecium tetraurelia TaxID=5888 RepID=A0BD36_PARTE|nr:uncharacterized protein GSPATT00004547001 [Paramecium tetraurelia]CAK56453.1 unnamed protein product [Paramecium tetraurelia]|eukprot:XP_001423851.1 hypothetical protein (macronuclear) [Paramecium tetraurelia strain d4-2]